MNITDFLLARIKEDEAAATSGLTSQMVGRTASTRRIAECHAKRAIINDTQTFVDEYANEEYRTNDDLTAGRVASRARFWQQQILRHLAAAYSDHPNYQQEWRP